MASTRLLVKNMPPEFTDVDKSDFLKLFGANEITPLTNFGKMQHCCYVSFPDSITTKQALETLHQFQVLDKRIVVEYAKPIHEKVANHMQSKNILEKKIDTVKEEKSLSKKEKQDDILTGICPKLNVNHAFPSHLTYKYPDPNITTLTNIANAMATVPKFYIQVLHLMNKMNLPAPFAGPTVSPPMQDDSIVKHDRCTDTSDLQDFVSSDESELETDADDKKPEIYQRNQLVEPVRKRKRLKALNKVNQEKFHIVPLKKPESVESAFELTSTLSKVEFNLATSIKEAVERKTQPPVHFNVFDERGDFGTIEPPQKEQPMEAESDSDDEEGESEDDNETTEYIQLKQLKENRISASEIVEMAQFKNYNVGNRTNRLYIKNLAKQVTEDELKFIFARFVRKCSAEEKELIQIRLMQEGRMKGQAFVTLPSEDIAEKAISLTHGYVLHDKPMVIQYGRAGK